MSSNLQAKTWSVDQIERLKAEFRSICQARGIHIPEPSVGPVVDPLDSSLIKKVMEELEVAEPLQVPALQKSCGVIRLTLVRDITLDLRDFMRAQQYASLSYNEQMNAMYHATAQTLRAAGYTVEHGDPPLYGMSWYSWLAQADPERHLFFFQE